jgi:hypothetical protein
MRLGARVKDQELEAVMERGRQIRRAPDVVRARLFVRARAYLAASTPATPVNTPKTPPVRPGRRIAAAATVLVVFTAAGGAAALYPHATRSTAIAPPQQRPFPKPSILAAAPEFPRAELAPSVSRLRRQSIHRTLSSQDSYDAEIDLLQRAQSEYASQDFPDALVLVAEHARRFPTGRLAEEREAMRVRSLAGLGRSDEACRALTAISVRFPRSVFLPGLREPAPRRVEEVDLAATRATVAGVTKRLQRFAPPALGVREDK